MNILQARKIPIDYTNGQKESLLMIEAIINKQKEHIKTLVYDVDGYPKDRKDYINVEFVLAGFAGVGKTTIAENILTYAKSVNYNTVVLAPTNKACNVLEKKLKGVEVSTLHKLLYGSPDDIFGQEWSLSTKIQKTVVLVDESSMVNTDIYNDIKEACEYGNVIIYMGDSFQLEPVGKNPNLFDKTGYLLTEVKRQANDSPILKMATIIRSINKIVAYEDNEDEAFFIHRNKTTLIDNYINYIRDSKDCIFIVDTNRERTAINNKVRQELGYIDTVVENERLISIANSNTYANGENFVLNNIISCKTVAFNLPQFKGSLNVKGVFVLAKDENDNIKPYLIVVNYDKPTLYHQEMTKLLNDDIDDVFELKKVFSTYATKSDKEKKDTISFNHNDRSSLLFAKKKNEYLFSKSVTICTYGYAISGHKSQGSQWEDVFVNQVWNEPNWNIARWFYTAITRSSKTLHVNQANEAISFKTNKQMNDKYEKITK